MFILKATFNFIIETFLLIWELSKILLLMALLLLGWVVVGQLTGLGDGPPSPPGSCMIAGRQEIC